MKTEENLRKNLEAEAVTVIRYCAYSTIAEEEGYRQVALLFKALADAERVHAVNTLRAMGELKDVSTGLYSSIDSKMYDYTQRYPTFIEQAEIDENPVAANTFNISMETSRIQSKLLNEAIDNLGRNREVDYWICQACGNVDTAEMPVSCRACGAARETLSKIERIKEYI